MNILVADPYVSRTDRGGALIVRQEPVVYEQGDYAEGLSAEQLHDYEDQGFLVVDSLFSETEVQELWQSFQALQQDPQTRKRPECILEPESKALRSVFGVHYLSEAVKKLVQDPRVLDVARQILGSEVYVHQSRINLKPGLNGKEFYWHSDFETWHVEDGMPAMRALSCSVLLTDNTSCNGPLMLIPQSHRQFVSCQGETPEENYKSSLRQQEVGVPDELSLRMLTDNGGLEAVQAKAGSVVFFDCNTLHASAGNLSPWPRANVFIVYNSVENQLRQPKYGLEPRPEYVAAREYVQPVMSVN